MQRVGGFPDTARAGPWYRMNGAALLAKVPQGGRWTLVAVMVAQPSVHIEMRLA